VLTLRGLVTYYVLFFIHLESRRVDIAGITVHPDEPWMKQIARNVTWRDGVRCGTVVIFCTIGTANLPDRSAPLLRQVLPVRSPNLNAYSERWVRSVKEECLSKVLLIGEGSLRLALSEYVAHYHAERNHQGKDNVLLFPRDTPTRRGGPVQCRERLGGLFHYYHQEAA
jgi:putative transposase